MEYSKFILSEIDNEYNGLVNNCDEYNEHDLFRCGMNNKILYSFSHFYLNNHSLDSKKDKFSVVAQEGSKWLDRFNRTLDILSDYLGNQNFVVIKTFKDPLDVTFDIDIVLKNDLSESISNLAKDNNFNIEEIEGGTELIPDNDDFLVIDVYKDFSFENKNFTSLDFILKNTRKHEYLGKTYCIPSKESELLLYISQINFQNRFITLHDFIQIKRTVSKSIDWQLLLSEIDKYGWKNNFLDTLTIVNGLYLDLYNEKLNVPIKSNKKFKSKFPVFLSHYSILKYDFRFFKTLFFKKRISKDLNFFVYKFISHNVRKKIPIYRDWINLDCL